MQPSLPFQSPYWEEDPNFDLDAHLHRVALPSPGGQAELEQMCSDLMSTPLDFSKPLWQIHVIENFGDGCAVMTRLHHCIADGMALVIVLLSMTDKNPDAPIPQPSNEPEEKKNGSLFGGMLGAVVKQATSTVNTARKMTERAVQEGVQTLVNPSRLLELAKQGTDVSAAVGRLVLRSNDPKTVFRGELGVRKKAAWSRPIPLPDVKAIKNVMGGTVNDVLVSAMSGALRRYLIEKGESVDNLNFRAAIPVNLRTQDQMGELGNKFGLVFLSMPIGIGDTVDRLAEVRKRMDMLKNSKEAIVAFGILGAMGRTPVEVQTQVVSVLAEKVTAVMTNVPGPPMPLYLAGQQIQGLMFWVPQAGRVGLGSSILSYANNVYLGLATDAGRVNNPNEIIDHFYEEFQTMLTLVEQTKES